MAIGRFCIASPDSGFRFHRWKVESTDTESYDAEIYKETFDCFPLSLGERVRVRDRPVIRQSACAGNALRLQLCKSLLFFSAKILSKRKLSFRKARSVRPAFFFDFHRSTALTV